MKTILLVHFFITDMHILHLDFKSNLLSRLFPRAKLTQYKRIVICSKTLIVTGIIIIIICNFEQIYFKMTLTIMQTVFTFFAAVTMSIT